MRKMGQLLMCLLGGNIVLAQGTLVVPGGTANVEGNSSSADLFRMWGGSTFQQVYAASEFASLGNQTGRIDAIYFRLDGAVQNFVGSWPSVSVSLFSTARSPDSLSPVYSDNSSSGSMVFGGSLFIRATNSLVDPRFFEVRIPCTTPFYYAPSNGNLVMTIATSGGPQDLRLDAQSTVGDGVGRVYGPLSGSGTVDTLGLITGFDITPIPEPRQGMLLLVVFNCFAIRWFMSRRRFR